MVRKILYSLIVVSLVLIVNQVRNVNGASNVIENGSAPPSTLVMTGSVEVRLSASQDAADVTAADLTISSVAIYLANGWSPMTLTGANTVDLQQIGDRNKR